MFDAWGTYLGGVDARNMIFNDELAKKKGWFLDYFYFYRPANAQCLNHNDSKLMYLLV